MSKAIIWVRSSTTQQECESQRDDLIKIATKDYHFKKSDLIQIGKVGASAIKLNKVYQQEVNQLLDAINNVQDLSTIFVWEVSRLARNEKAFYAMKDEIIKKKIQLICNVPQIKLLDDNGEVNEGMEITLNLLVTLAKQEMKIKKERFARGKKQKAKEGKFAGGRIPFGYRVNSEKDKFIDIDEEEAELVKLIFNMYEAGYSQTRIATELKEQGYKNPRYKQSKNIQLGQISNILNNECYTGIQLEEKEVKYKDKTDNEEIKWTRYSRKYPQIITVEQFKRCREIALKNRTITGKGKNIYYATRLVKCPTCGCFWSASGSKVNYHCYNAVKPAKTWEISGRTTEQCQNRTSLSINILDSVLWYFAKREETEFVIRASEERIENLKKKISDNKKKMANIPEQIDVVDSSLEKLALRNAEGAISDETYEKKREEKNKTKSELIDKMLSYKKNIDELKAAIKKLEFAFIKYGLRRNSNSTEVDVVNEQVHQYNELYESVSSIANDTERYGIIHRMIEEVSIENVRIKFKYKIGWKQTNAKKIVIKIPNWREDDYFIKLFGKYTVYYVPKYTVYYVPNMGKGYGVFLDVNNNNNLILNSVDYFDNEGKTVGKLVNLEWINDYKRTAEVQFENQEKPHLVSIIDIPYLNRFTDYGKYERQERDRKEAYKPVEGYLRIEDIISETNLTYGQVYSAIDNGTLKAQIIRHKCFISPKDAEEYIKRAKEKKEKLGNRISALQVAKEYKLDYGRVLRAIRKGAVPFVHKSNHYYVTPEDAKEYFGKILKKKG